MFEKFEFKSTIYWISSLFDRFPSVAFCDAQRCLFCCLVRRRTMLTVFRLGRNLRESVEFAWICVNLRESAWICVNPPFANGGMAEWRNLRESAAIYVNPRFGILGMVTSSLLNVPLSIVAWMTLFVSFFYLPIWFHYTALIGLDFAA